LNNTDELVFLPERSHAVDEQQDPRLFSLACQTAVFGDRASPHLAIPQHALVDHGAQHRHQAGDAFRIIPGNDRADVWERLEHP
jgi:hypothetical protein